MKRYANMWMLFSENANISMHGHVLIRSNVKKEQERTDLIAERKNQHGGSYEGADEKI